MANWKKLAQGAAGAAGGAALNVEDVFSTYLYDGAGNTAQTITNGIDLDGEGGLIWFKDRNVGIGHALFDSENNSFGSYLESNNTNASTTLSHVTANSDGFSLSANGYGITNGSGIDYASWTFRKAPKFFDIVTYTGNGTSGRTVSHNLGCDVGCMIIKDINNANSWVTFHRGVGANKYLELNSTSNSLTASWMFNNTAPTSSVFTLGNNVAVNYSGRQYIAYLFAHNDGDGEFGPTGDQDIIKCGLYIGTGTNGNSIDLGFEPQFLIIKNTSTSRNWLMYDSMRGLVDNGYDQALFPNASSAEALSGYVLDPDPTGFTVGGNDLEINGNGNGYLYIAIRRGPMAVPESATDVFAIDFSDATAPQYYSGFPVDMAIESYRGGNNHEISSRLTNGRMYTNITNAEDRPTLAYDQMDGWKSFAISNTTQLSYMWRRAPNYFDVVTYTGNYNGGSSPQTLDHNLGVAPEMIWIKNRSRASNWVVYHKGLDGGTNPETHYLLLQSSAAEADATFFNDTAPTDTQFTVGSFTDVNRLNENHIAYLFASLDGVSKLGSYTGNGSTQDISLGFSPRLFITKNTDSSYPWYLFDSERGIVAGNDPFIILNTNAAEGTLVDMVDPITNGIRLINSSVNNNGDNYIYYAIA